MYDGSDVICEYNANDALVCRYILGRSIDEPMRMERLIEGEWRNFYYQTNQLGTIAALTGWDAGESEETIIERYTYDAYGRLLVQTPGADGDFGTSDDDYQATSTVGNPYGFTARRLDEETGLMYYRARYYSVPQDRFVSRDPKGYIDGMNLYIAYFVPNSRDPMGWLHVRATAHRTTTGEQLAAQHCALCPGREVRKSKATECAFAKIRCEGWVEDVHNLGVELTWKEQKKVGLTTKTIPNIESRIAMIEQAIGIAGLSTGATMVYLGGIGMKFTPYHVPPPAMVFSLPYMAYKDVKEMREIEQRLREELFKKRAEVVSLEAQIAQLRAKMSYAVAQAEKYLQKIQGDECCCPAK